MRPKRIMIGVLCVVVLIMIVGFAAFSTKLNISGTSNIKSNWNVLFTNIQELRKSSGVIINSVPSISGTTATFDVGLSTPGDSIEYQITVENRGTLDAIIENIETTETENSALLFEVSEIEKGDKLAKNTTTTFNIKISYNSSITSQPEELNKTLTINITYVQDIGQAIEPEIEPTLVDVILENNHPQSDTNIDFSKASIEDGTEGLYYTNKNTEDDKTTYYFRGAIENNYVYFAGFYWRIIRINEDGSIRLIYQGKTIDAMGSEATIGKNVFNESSDDNAYVGYMYGKEASSTYEETHANINDSTMKTILDSWYEENLLQDYSIYLTDPGFCGDRSVAPAAGLWNSNDSALGYGKNYTYYGAYQRIYKEKQPQFICSQSNDLYTIGSSNKGNRMLDYPIGLITADEVAYAGANGGVTNSESYLYTGDWYWTMTPIVFGGSDNGAGVFDLYFNGHLDGNLVTDLGGIRPVINLKSNSEYYSGNGTKEKPYELYPKMHSGGAID